MKVWCGQRLPRKWRHCERGKSAAVLLFLQHSGSARVGELSRKTGLSLWNTMTVCQSLCTYGLARRIRETLRKPVEDRAFESVKTNPDPCLQPCPHTAARGEENENSRGYPE